MSDSANFIFGSILSPDDAWLIGSHTARWWAFLLLFIGFVIKLPAVPLHTWLPDAHVEAPTPISVILAALLLKVGAYGLLRIAYPIFPDAAVELSSVVAFIGVLSIIYAALNALAAKDLKRLVAYSSVSHMGFVLLGLASLTVEGVAGAVYQMFSHGLISAMLFLIAGVLYDRTHDRLINNYSGLASRMPMFFVFVLIAFFASLGLPGFSGFIAELMVLLGALASGSTNELIAQLGGYDLESVEINGVKPNSLKGLRLSDGTLVTENIAFTMSQHPSSLSRLTPEQASKALKESFARLNKLKEETGWFIEPDQDSYGRKMRNRWSEGLNYEYGRADIRQGYFEFGAPEDRRVSRADASRLDKQTIVAGTREKAKFDYQTIKKAKWSQPSTPKKFR